MSNDAGSDDPREVGSVGEEAAKLFGALAEWAKDVGDHVDTGDVQTDDSRRLDTLSCHVGMYDIGDICRGSPGTQIRITANEYFLSERRNRVRC